MKRLLFILCVICWLEPVIGQARENFSPQLAIGFHYGLNRASIDFIPSIGEQPISLYSTGFIINYIREPHLGLQIELNMSQRGWQEENDTAGSYSRTMNYLEVPVLTHITANIKNIRLNFDLGPYVAFFQDYSEKYDPGLRIISPGDTLLGDINYYGKDIDSKFDYGFMGGVGLGYNTLIGEFQLRFRYTQGMISVFKKYPEGNFRYTQARCFYFGAAYYYTFTFHKKK